MKRILAADAHAKDKWDRQMRNIDRVYDGLKSQVRGGIITKVPGQIEALDKLLSQMRESVELREERARLWQVCTFLSSNIQNQNRALLHDKTWNRSSMWLEDFSIEIS
jgi:hypothetical protein